jgi:hypothetical protein
MVRVYRHYEEWEDWQAGMYRSVPSQLFPALTVEAANVLSDPIGLDLNMRAVTSEWVNAATVVFSNPSRNHRAWLGQAACCFATTAPEYVTKAAWRTLSVDQQRIANSVADVVIADWRNQQGLFNG